MAKGKFGLGLLVAAVGGLFAGWLTAKKSGKETREDLKNQAKRMHGHADDKKDELKARAESAKKEATAKAEEYKKRAENAVQGAKEGFNKNPHKK